MTFRIEAFTHKGVLRDMNQDCILVHDHVMNKDVFSLIVENSTRCFVADGVGGNPAGDIAAKMVIQNLNEKLSFQNIPDRERLVGLCKGINEELIGFGEENKHYEGLATTLAGIIFCEKQYWILNAGDSAVLRLRNKQLQKLTIDQVLAAEISNSPITSYFGGIYNSLDLVVSKGIGELEKSDIFMVSSDGIFKVLTHYQVEKILSNSKSLKEKSDFIFYKAIQNGAPDNISSIFIEVH